MAYRVLMGRKYPFLLLEGRTGERCAHEAPRRGIRKDGTWYTYGWDLTKNICESARRPPKGRLREQAVRAIGQTRSVCPAGARSREAAPSQVFSSGGTILTAYTYTPYGSVTANGNVTQPIQWSSEYSDSELGLVYYNYRHYNPFNGKWISRDPLGEVTGVNDYAYVENQTIESTDFLGLIIDTVWDVGNMIWDVGKIVTGAVSGNKDLMTEGAVDLALDTAAAIIPGVPAGASKAARVASKKAAKQLAAKQAECLAIRNGYKQLNCNACSAQCMRCSDVRASLQCFTALAAGRLLYLRKRCDYYLEGSRKRGSQIAEKGHRKAHRDAIGALNKCKKRLFTCKNY